MNDHKSDIRKHKNTPVANHFNLPQHTLENLQVQSASASETQL